MADVSKNRWIREVPTNLCLLYLSYLPLQFQVPPVKWQFDAGYLDPPKGRFFGIRAISENCWFTMENWIDRRYHTLFLYSFSWTTPITQLMAFTFHIVPSTGLSSFWCAYFAGSIGGGIGKVLEYYYGLRRIHNDRRARQEKYNFEDIATKQYQLAMGEISDTSLKKQAYNPHDYIDDALLNKLYYTSNAKEAVFGPENAIYGMIGYSAALSGHYLYKQISKYLNERINDMNDNEQNDENGDTNDQKNENEKMNILNVIKGYRQSAINFYHFFVFGVSLMNIAQTVIDYSLQMKEKREEKGGYAFMTSGKGNYGVDFGILAACGSGVLAYPIVLKLQKTRRAKSICKKL